MVDDGRPSLVELGQVIAAHEPATFCLYRHQDVTGASGTGVVAFGTQFHDGTVVLRWMGADPSTVVWPSLEAAEREHGHKGATEVVFLHQPTFEPDPDSPLSQEIAHLFAGDLPPELVEEITRRLGEARVLQGQLDGLVNGGAGARDTARSAIDLARQLLMMFETGDDRHPGGLCVRTGWIDESVLARLQRQFAELQAATLQPEGISAVPRG